MISNPTLRLVPLVLALSLLSLIACQREAKAPPGAVKIDDSGGTVETDTARVVVAPDSVSAPIYVSVKDLPLTAPLPDPTLPPEVKLIAAARFEQSHPFPEEWQNFFLPQVQLSLRNAVAPVKNGGYFTELCFWWPSGYQESPLERDFWACSPIFDVAGGDPTQKGSGWATTDIKGFGREGMAFYLFQYPRDWARANCEAAGGVFSENAPGFFHACGYLDPDYFPNLGRVIYNPIHVSIQTNSGIALPQQSDNTPVPFTWNVGNTHSRYYYKLYDDKDISDVAKELQRNDPDIVHLQEVFVEYTYCPIHPESSLCQGDEPVIERVLRLWRGSNWRNEVDYFCLMYECTIIKKRTASGLRLEFLDKQDPMFANYITGVAGEDTGYLFTMIKLLYPDGKEELLASFNEHTATPLKLAGAKIRAKQFQAQRDHILDLLGGGGGLPYQSLAVRSLGTSPGGYNGPPPDGILKMGDFNVHLIPYTNHLPKEWIADEDDIALWELVGTIGEDENADQFFDDDGVEDRAFGQRKPALLWRVGSDDYYTGYIRKSKWFPMATDMIASNRYVGSCRVTNDLARYSQYGFDHNPISCELEPVKTIKFTGSAERGGVNMRYAGSGVGPSARAGALFPNKGFGFGAYRATFLDVEASFPVIYNPDGTFTVEVPEHILKAGLPVWVRYCVPQLGCKVAKLDPNNPNFTVPFNDDCDEQSAQSASAVR